MAEGNDRIKKEETRRCLQGSLDSSFRLCLPKIFCHHFLFRPKPLDWTSVLLRVTYLWLIFAKASKNLLMSSLLPLFFIFLVLLAIKRKWQLCPLLPDIVEPSDPKSLVPLEDLTKSARVITAKKILFYKMSSLAQQNRIKWDVKLAPRLGDRLLGRTSQESYDHVCIFFSKFCKGTWKTAIIQLVYWRKMSGWRQEKLMVEIG